MDSLANSCDTADNESVQKLTSVERSNRADTSASEDAESSSGSCSKQPKRSKNDQPTDVQCKRMWKKRRLVLHKKKLRLEIDILELLKQKEEVRLKIQLETLKQELLNTKIKELELRKTINSMMGRIVDDLC